jgi:hypothetical protein
MARIYQFDKLKEPEPGCSYGKYWLWSVKKYGRYFFRLAIQEHQDDLAPDPWWTQGDGNDV